MNMRQDSAGSRGRQALVPLAGFLHLPLRVNAKIPMAFGLAAGGALLLRSLRTKSHVERFAAAALETLLNAIEANDPDTGMHVRRVAARALVIADAAGLDE